jgi:lipid II:glycine glycyltransferase (peptidoglycan interpeptide bridge formation enzyme)
LTRTLGVLYKYQGHLSEHKQISNQRRWLSALLDQFPPDNFVQMCMHHNFTDWLPFKWNGFRQTTRYTYIVQYQNKSFSELWKNLNWGRRNSIERSAKNNIRVETTDDFDLLYHFECLSYERQGLDFRIPFEDLKLLDEAIKEKGNRAIFKAIDNLNQVHAMLYVVFNAKSACLLMSGSDVKYRKLGGHTLVLWEAVRYFCDKVEYFNFCGSDIQQIEEHFRGFGGTLTPYFLIYNEKLMWKRNDIRYHIGETSFHLREVYKIVKNKILRTFRYK